MAKELRDSKALTIECHEELIKILDKIKSKVKETTWGVVIPSNYEATKILAQKVNFSKII